MKRSEFIFFAMAALSVLAPSCKKVTVGIDNDLIRVRISAESAKATIVTTSSITTDPGKFSIDAYVDTDAGMDATYQYPAGTKLIDSDGSDNVIYNTETTTWDITGAPKWIRETDIAFWSRVNMAGINPLESSVLYPSASLSGGPHFDFTVSALPQSASNQKDLLLAYNLQAFSESKTSVDIHFYHALAEIRLAVSPDDESFDTGVSIKKVVIKNVYGGGTCSFRPDRVASEFDSTFVWKQDTATQTASFDITPNTPVTVPAESNGTMTGWTKGTYQRTGKSKYTLFTCDNSMMIVPQTMAKNSVMELTIVNKDSSESTITASLTLNSDGTPLNLIAGYYYKFKLNYTKANQQGFTAELIDWNKKDIAIDVN